MIWIALFRISMGPRRKRRYIRVYRFVCGIRQRMGLQVPSVRSPHFRGSQRHCGDSIVVRGELRDLGKYRWEKWRKRQLARNTLHTVLRTRLTGWSVG